VKCEINKNKTKSELKLYLFGIGIGIIVSLVALSAELDAANLSFTVANLMMIHQAIRLNYLIDLVPMVLFLFAYGIVRTCRKKTIGDAGETMASALTEMQKCERNKVDHQLSEVLVDKIGSQ
jgi:hypothetical protein